MVLQMRRSINRSKKLEVVYLIICLCLQLINDISAIDSFPKRVQSTGLMKNSSENRVKIPSKAGNGGSNANELSRKSRSTSDRESSYIVFENGDELEAFKDIFSDQESQNPNIDRKRNKGTFMIPQPRIGRSKVDPNLIMPYPDSWLVPYLSKTQIEMAETETPVYVVDEDLEIDSEYFSEEEEDEESDAEEESLLSDDEELDKISERQVDRNGTVIPYPRFGKRNINFSEKSELNTRVKRATDSVIPQIRVGRSSQKEKSVKPVKQSLYILPNYRPGRSSSGAEKYSKYDKNTKPGILPYPRPGRSNDMYAKRQDYILPQPRVGRSLIESKDIAEMDMVLKLNPSKIEKGTGELLKSEESKLFLIPYPRPGKRFFGTKPLPPNVNLQPKNKDQLPFEDTVDKEQAVITFLVPYPRPGRSESGKQYLIPNARFGKSTSNSVQTFSRYDRSTIKNPNIILPYPRPGRSVSLIPNARFGRSNLLPYFRPDRSSTSILPYPRLGRNTYSSSIIPQMRVGKSSSSSVIPQMRVGKSSSSVIPQIRVGKSYSSVAPQMRVGKSFSLIPQMRVGKSASSVIPQMRVGKSFSLIPQLRVGKSASSVIPQMRVGKSASSVIPQMRVGKSASSVIPQMRVGKSNNSFRDAFADEDEDPMLSNTEEQYDLGLLDEESNNNLNDFLTDSNINNIKSTVFNTEKKLEKPMLTSGSNYMLPYPRPGRFVQK